MSFYYQSFGESLKSILDTPLTFFSFFSYALYCIRFKKPQLHQLSTLLVLALTGYLITYLIQKMNWYYHAIPLFSMAALADVVLLTTYFEKKLRETGWILIASSLGFSLFFYFSVFILSFYSQGTSQTKELKPLICFLHKTEQHQPAYFFSAYTAYMVAVLEHADIQHASRLQFLAWMRSYYKKDILEKLTPAQKKDNSFFANILAEDLNKNRPKMMLIDKHCAIIKNGHCLRINYLKFLNRSEKFKSAWKNYHYVMSIRKINVYRFDIYARDNAAIASPSCKVFSACNKEFHSTAFCSHSKITVDPSLK